MTDLQRLMRLYETVFLIRQAEERLARIFADGEVPGFIHLSIGQEAIAAGVAAALQPTDTIASTHRGHGHALAKGMALDAFFAEILGHATGICHGRGGSMHVADFSIGMLGANGIVGAGIPIATGSALAHQTSGRSEIAVAFFGDGSIAEGVLHECLNIAALWSLPLLLVCENNQWAEFSPSDRQLAVKLRDLGAAFRLGYVEVDGNDVAAVFAAAVEAVSRIRTGGGPQILECHTTRMRGHYEGDPQKYRNAGERAANEANDPVTRARSRLAADGMGEAEIAALEVGITARVEQALAEARRAAPEPFEAATRGVYATAGSATYG